jgi:hypothetical protein
MCCVRGTCAFKSAWKFDEKIVHVYLSKIECVLKNAFASEFPGKNYRVNMLLDYPFKLKRLVCP